ncbi:uncharacterized protein LOC109846695 [Asparagus officinalis]|uniref:uncharacterized protein LOC109846695 n=1 Tax=Asparagus officinalis TaxID=4686 RepID=UPI00098E79E6|nr:uncharacterized protein LOC109846695 [Asparagus officinalis]
MNFDAGGPSYLSSSSYSDDDNFLSNIITEIDETEEVICEYINNNMIPANNLHQQNYQPIHGGSIPDHTVINRDRETAHQNLVIDYLADNPRFEEDMFRRRYRMSRSLFLRIVDAVKDHDYYFQQRSDGLGRIELSLLQKVTAVFCMLAYSLPADTMDEYVKIGESTAIESMTKFYRAMVEIFAERYLRTPNAKYISRLLYIGRSGSPTIILEAVADYDLWIWHAYFGMPGTNNDINVLESSNIFSNLAQADGIYPKWATIVQTIQQPQCRKTKYFAMKQKACRKDVERAFGVLQSQFAIVAGSARFWKKHVLHDIMIACIIMHNMIIEDEHDLYAPIQEVREIPTPEVDIVADETTSFTQFITRYRQIKDKDAHIVLCNALIDHLWEEYTISDS